MTARVETGPSAETRLSRALTTLVFNHPFFATIAYRLKRVSDPTCETAWTDGEYLGYNPAYIESLSRDETVGLVTHEVGHVVSLHPLRMEGRDAKQWNIATDKVVNHMVVNECGFVLPEGSIPGVGGKSAEELYVPPTPGGGGGQGKQQQGAGSGKKSGQKPGQKPGQQESPGQGDGKPQQSNDPGRSGEVRAPKNPDGSQLSEAQRQQRIEDTRVMVRQAITAGMRAGTMPAGLKRLVDDLVAAKVPWKEILSRFVDQWTNSDYSWAQPNKRYLNSGFFLPSLRSEAYGQIVMGCDTSGSISQAQLKEVASEVLGALDAYVDQGEPRELTIAWFDTKVYPQTVLEAEELHPEGGGGTSFRVVFDWLKTLEGEPPKAIIMVTDGHSRDFGEQPDIPVLWVLTATNQSFKPPFGELTCTLDQG
jgi:predicted metal-dependent peptidase